MTGMEIAAGAMSAGGGLVSALSGVSKAEAQNRQSQARASAAFMNAQLDVYNQQLALRNAGLALAEGESDQQDNNLRTQRTMAKMKAAFGASGLDVGASALDVLQDSALQGAYDNSKIGFKADVTALQQRDKAQQFGFKAQRDLQEGFSASQEEADPTLDIFSSIFKTGTSLMGNKGVQGFFGG